MVDELSNREQFFCPHCGQPTLSVADGGIDCLHCEAPLTEGPIQILSDDDVDDYARQLWGNLTEGDGQHSEGLDVNIISGAMRSLEHEITRRINADRIRRGSDLVEESVASKAGSLRTELGQHIRDTRDSEDTFTIADTLQFFGRLDRFLAELSTANKAVTE